MQFDAHQHKLKTRGKPYKDLKLLTMKGMNAIQKYVCHSAQENGNYHDMNNMKLLHSI